MPKNDWPWRKTEDGWAVSARHLVGFDAVLEVGGGIYLPGAGIIVGDKSFQEKLNSSGEVDCWELSYDQEVYTIYND